MNPAAGQIHSERILPATKRSASGLRALRRRLQAHVVVLTRRPEVRVGLTRQLLEMGCQVDAPECLLRLSEWAADRLLCSGRPCWPDLVIMVGGRVGARELEVLSGLKRAGWPTAFLLAGLSRRQSRRLRRLAPGRILVTDADIEPEDLLTAACWLLHPGPPGRPAIGTS